MLRSVTSATVEVHPACPEGSAETPTPDHSRVPGTPLVAIRRAFDAIPAEMWDRLAGRNPWATPFSRWAFQRAWWDGYGAQAHDQTIVVVDPAAIDGEPVGIVPLMHRHAVSDPETRTMLRHGSAGDPFSFPATAKAVFFGASYHADYATILADPADLPAVSDALAAGIATPQRLDPDHPEPWDLVDLRRLRCGDPAAEALETAFRARATRLGWRVDLEREDVCPVLTVPDGVSDLEGYLAGLGKKDRHEIRRKLRRAVAHGPVALTESLDPLADLDAFIDLHQRRWGADGLFPPTQGGAASRRFVRRLFEKSGPNGAVRLCFLTIGDRRVGAGITFEEGDTIAYYNAGIDPAASDLSPGVVMIAAYLERVIATGRRRLDFLRGDEVYKYEWGALDEPIQRLLVRRGDRG
jgi:CelD/BcsL family acetyltransferase involved in cellulose biosynthesis